MTAIASSFGQRKLGVHARIHVRLPRGYVEVDDAGDSHFLANTLVTMEEFEEERFFAFVRRTYWQSPAGAPTRKTAEGLIRKLEF